MRPPGTTLVALLTSEAVSTAGTAMTFVALPWFVLVTTGSAPRTSLVLAVQVVPMALFGIPSGTVVVALGARTTMLVSDGLRAVLIAAVPVLSWAGQLTYPRLLALVFLVGVFSAPYIAAQRSIVPELFGDDEAAVSRASALFGAATQLPLVVGPALAGALIAAFGAPAVLLVDAGTYVFALLCILVLVDRGRRLATPAADDARGVLAGVRYLRRDRLLGPLTLTVIVLDGAAGCLAVAVPLLAYSRYDADPRVAGWLFTAFGVGALAGFAASARLLEHVAPLRLATVGVLAMPLPLWLVAAPLPWPAACVALAAFGAFVPLVNAPTMGLLSTRPPPALRAKVLTAVLTASGLGSPVGRLLVGPIYHRAGNAGVWLAAAAGLTLGGVLYVVAVARARGAQPATVLSA